MPVRGHRITTFAIRYRGKANTLVALIYIKPDADVVAIKPSARALALGQQTLYDQTAIAANRKRIQICQIHHSPSANLKASLPVLTASTAAHFART